VANLFALLLGGQRGLDWDEGISPIITSTWIIVHHFLCEKHAATSAAKFVAGKMSSLWTTTATLMARCWWSFWEGCGARETPESAGQALVSEADGSSPGGSRHVSFLDGVKLAMGVSVGSR